MRNISAMMTTTYNHPAATQKTSIFPNKIHTCTKFKNILFVREVNSCLAVELVSTDNSLRSVSRADSLIRWTDSVNNFSNSPGWNKIIRYTKLEFCSQIYKRRQQITSCVMAPNSASNSKHQFSLFSNDFTWSAVFFSWIIILWILRRKFNRDILKDF